jgi:DNA-binding IclR family transcriptional regulator
MGTPSAERVVQILDFLTTHPGRGFTASELSRQLRLSKSTTYKILGTLTDGGLARRHPDTLEYRLGPALVAMGTVAERSLPALTYAKREAERLAEQHDTECVIMAATGHELLIVYHAGLPGPLSATFQEGQRQPLAPPMGPVVLAWTSDDAVEAWLHRLGAEVTDDERERYRAAVEAVRRRGYSVGIGVPRLYELQALYASGDLHTPQGRRELSLKLAAFARNNSPPMVDELPPDAEISGVTAPVFDADGTMLFAIGITGATYRVRDVPALSRAVVRAAGRVMAAIGGRQPAGARIRPRGRVAGEVATQLTEP